LAAACAVLATATLEVSAAIQINAIRIENFRDLK